MSPDNDFDSALETEDDAVLAEATASAPRYRGKKGAEPEPITFEGRVVDRTEIIIKGLTELSEAYDGLKISLDDRVRLLVEARAAGVGHYVDKEGQLVRSQTLRVNLADIVPWDPTDPDDDGVIRA